MYEILRVFLKQNFANIKDECLFSHKEGIFLLNIMCKQSFKTEIFYIHFLICLLAKINSMAEQRYNI